MKTPTVRAYWSEMPWAASQTNRRRRGTAMLECAIVLPLLLMLLLGTMEVGRFVEVQQVMTEAGAVGGRQASLGTQNNEQVKQAVLNYLASARIPTENVTVTVTNVTHPDLEANQAIQLDDLQIDISMPVKDISWVTSGLFVDGNQTVGATSRWASARGRVYPTDIRVPAGY